MARLQRRATYVSARFLWRTILRAETPTQTHAVWYLYAEVIRRA